MIRAERRPLAVLLAASVVSVTGSSLTLMGVPWFVLESTGSAADAGVVAFCAMLPVALGALVGGPVVDRLGRQRVSVASDLVCGAAVGAVPLLQSAGLLRLWALCALMAVTGLFHAPGDTARGVLLPAVAGRAGVALSRAASLYDGASRCAGMIGSAAGGVMIAVLGASHVLIVDAATFAASAVLIAGGLRGLPEPRSRTDPGKAGSGAYRRALVDGCRYVLASPLLLGMCVVAMLAQVLDQGWSTVLLPLQVRDRLGGPSALGLVEALFCAGALAGALLYGAVGHRWPRRPVYAVAFLIVGAPRFVVAALTGTVPPLAVMMTVEGLACGAINPILATAVYQFVPDRMRSRVLSAMTASALLIAPLGGLAAGFAAGALGLPAALLVAGCAYFLVTLGPAILPAWKRLDHPSEIPAIPGPPAAALTAPGGCDDQPAIAGSLSQPRPADGRAGCHDGGDEPG